MSKKKIFDYLCGNPPYNSDFDDQGNQKKFASPVYNIFMDAAFKVADKVELITPARFLFNAGATPENWNLERLDDPHFKVLEYNADASKVFPSTDIKGGVAITYRDSTKNFGAIGVFTAFEELGSILTKVTQKNENNLSDFIFNRGLYRFSDLAYKEHPEELKKLSDSRIGAGVFEKMSSIFYQKKPNDKHEYAKFLGLLNNKRVYRWFRIDYFKMVDNFSSYKVIVPKANGSGALGEVLSTPLIGYPLIGYTETFLSIGNFKTEFEASACLSYVKTKFCRVMLGILKTTQDNPSTKWIYVPIQDFTPSSDIDWSKSIHEIDVQLYKKYGLDQHEIDFIETNVKEMN